MHKKYLVGLFGALALGAVGYVSFNGLVSSTSLKADVVTGNTCPAEYKFKTIFAKGEKTFFNNKIYSCSDTYFCPNVNPNGYDINNKPVTVGWATQPWTYLSTDTSCNGTLPPNPTVAPADLTVKGLLTAEGMADFKQIVTAPFIDAERVNADRLWINGKEFNPEATIPSTGNNVDSLTVNKDLTLGGQLKVGNNNVISADGNRLSIRTDNNITVGSNDPKKATIGILIDTDLQNYPPMPTAKSLIQLGADFTTFLGDVSLQKALSIAGQIKIGENNIISANGNRLNITTDNNITLGSNNPSKAGVGILIDTDLQNYPPMPTAKSLIQLGADFTTFLGDVNVDKLFSAKTINADEARLKNLNIDTLTVGGVKYPAADLVNKTPATPTNSFNLINLGKYAGIVATEAGESLTNILINSNKFTVKGDLVLSDENIQQKQVIGIRGQGTYDCPENQYITGLTISPSFGIDAITCSTL